jgi:alpha-L-rhamnosidase
VVCGLTLLGLGGSVFGQDILPPHAAYLDPARDGKTLQASPGNDTRAEFIWTRGDAAALSPNMLATVRGQNDKIAPHFFRATFSVARLPPHATLYIAGPRSASIFLNGTKVLEFNDSTFSGKGFHVLSADVAASLKTGRNVLAIQEVRGHSSLHTGASATINQVTYGEVLAVEILPREPAVNGPPLLASDSSWRSTLVVKDGWNSSGFDDSEWPLVQSLGVLGSRGDFLQWNADAGLYAWPGYSGIGPAMRTFWLAPISAREVSSRPDSGTPQPPRTVLLDFGKEIVGRVELTSTLDQSIAVDTSYGESVEEASTHPYLGVRQVIVPPHAEVFGPKSGFRYVQLSLPAAVSDSSLRVQVQGIIYPIAYRGSFDSSDALLNRIWETGAYTAHLCMQEGIWDGVKRDRGRWMGDLDVTGRVISDVFADKPLMESTLNALIGDSPVVRDVNTIAGYSSFWITGQADFFLHVGDLDYLRTQHQKLLDLLHVMDGELDSAGLFTDPEKHKIFVDWSPGFSSDTPEARAATHFEFYLAYQQAAFLLDALGDSGHALAARTTAAKLSAAAQSRLLDAASNTFGTRWQTNAIAVDSGAATPAEERAIWQDVLSHVLMPTGPEAVVTPYYGYYVLEAMARLNQRPEALQWIRQYWGGMLAEGATSFWEAYDPRWPKDNFHDYLEADGKTGTYVSLAHGWSSGPTAWLMEQILGIEPTAAGFHEVTIRPDLAGLKWARGTEPSPRGLIHVDVKPESVAVTLPADTVATISLPFASQSGKILQNGRPILSIPEEGTMRSVVVVRHAGSYTFTLEKGSNR